MAAIKQTIPIAHKSGRKDLSNNIFGKLRVIDYHSTKNKRAYWNCICECGNSKIAQGKLLLNSTTKSCGCLVHRKRHKDLTNKKFGRLTVLQLSKIKIDPKVKRVYWDCVCGCGNKSIAESYDLTSGNTKSCGCYQKSRASEASIKRFGLKKGEASFNDLYRNYKNGAKTRSLEFNLHKDEARLLFTKDCFYCGRPPSKVFNRKKNNGSFTYNGIDRVNSSEGYKIENCVPCCSNCNVAKLDMSKDEFRDWIIRIFTHLELNNW